MLTREFSSENFGKLRRAWLLESFLVFKELSVVVRVT